MDWVADHTSGCMQNVLDYVIKCNSGCDASYGNDALSSQCKEILENVFETSIEIAIVPTGTAANSLALSCLVPPYGSILCASGAHIQTSECGAPEFYSGAKLELVIQDSVGKINPENLLEIISSTGKKLPHESLISAVSLTQPTESGAVYSIKEIKNICLLAHKYGSCVHMDGARFANAVAYLNESPANITWRQGVDCLSFGTTKNGTINCKLNIE